jgi:hypothetical protein
MELVTLQVTVASDAELGSRDLRLEASAGLTNPLVFCVGQLPEVSKKAVKPDDRMGDGQLAARLRNEPQQATPPPPPMDVALPAVINGQIMPGEYDRYRFKAKKGERLVLAVSARELIPYLPDAVPGWFQAALSLKDSKGTEVAFTDHFQFHPDPVLYYKIPADGSYMIEIRDSIYRGREDFVYRITVGQLPFITSIFPLGGKAGLQTVVKAEGWNLHSSTLTVDATGKEPGILPLSIHSEGQSSNIVPFAVDTLPECVTQKPNHTQAEAQPVTLPTIVNGRVDRQGEWDVFRFEGRKGQKLVAEVYARRLDSPLDSVLKLTDAAGKQLAYNDDNEDKGSGLNTHHADSLLTATLPADGSYFLYLGDVQQKAGAAYGYRLRISEPRPDFALRVVPASLNARAGQSVPITVYALRRDGFSQEIPLALKNAPAGFKLSGGRVPADQDQVQLTLTVPSNAPDAPVDLNIEGRAQVDGAMATRLAVPAEDMMQAFAYRHLVPAKNMLVVVLSRGRGRIPEFVGDKPVKLAAGKTTPVRFSVPNGPMASQIKLELKEPPEGIAVDKVSTAQDGMTILMRTDADKVKLGSKGNLIVEAFVERPAGGKAKTVAGKQQISLGTLPAIPFEVVK